MNHPLQFYYSRIYKTYDLVNRIFTFGLDKKWRNYTVKACLAKQPGCVLDLCCGTGDLTLALFKNAHSSMHITGYDLNPEMLELARKKAMQNQADVDFILGNAGSMPFSDNEFDAITIGFGFRNLTWHNSDREKYIREISRVLKPNGNLLILESARPENSVMAGLYNLYLKLILVPLGGMLSGSWKAYQYLAGSSAGFYNYAELQTILLEHRLDLHTRRIFLFGSVNLLIATKKVS